MNPNQDENLSQYNEYKLYSENKYKELLDPDDITNLPLDEFVVINGIEFKMLDDIKIYILENNLKLSLKGEEDILSEPYQYQNMSDNDIKHLKMWFWWLDKPKTFYVE